MKNPLFMILLASATACQDITPLLEYEPAPKPERCAWPIAKPVDGQYAACLPALSQSTFDIVTWNVENFPKSEENTILKMKEIVETLNPDIIALQEIESSFFFNQLIESLEGWAGVMGSGFQRPAYLYKTSEVKVSSTGELFPSETYAFPRAPLVMSAEHVSGKEIILINVHFKCCDDDSSINRRKNAASKLKQYTDDHYSDSAVIILGDMNEEITQPEGNNVLSIFYDDHENYRFSDRAIADCGPEHWSYPNWPSHIDHILITNELFDAVQETRTLRLRECDDDFLEMVTDHHPLLIRLDWL